MKGTCNSVIIFSTQGYRSQADRMGGGDYDGDLYLVIYNQEIVMNVTEAEPYHAYDYKAYEVNVQTSSTTDASLTLSNKNSPLSNKNTYLGSNTPVYTNNTSNNYTLPNHMLSVPLSPGNIRSISSPHLSAVNSPTGMISSPGNDFDSSICQLLFDNAFNKSLNDNLGLYSLIWLCLADHNYNGKETLLLGHICRSAVDANKNVSMFTFPSTYYYLEQKQTKILKPDYMKHIFPTLTTYPSISINSDILKHIDKVIRQKDFINYIPYKLDEDLLQIVIEINGKAMIVWSLLDYIDDECNSSALTNKSKINHTTKQIITNNYNYQKSNEIITFLNESIILTKSEQWSNHLKQYKTILVSNPKPSGFSYKQLKLDYYHIFQNDSRELFNACSNVLNNWDINIFQRILASIIYHKTFYCCKDNNICLIPKQMSFIEICLNELLQNKSCLLKMKMNRSLNDPRSLYNPK